MIKESSQIIHMQIRLVVLATKKWHIPLKKVNILFQKYNVYHYIARHFGIFHMEGDLAILEDIKSYMSANGFSA